MDTITVLGRQAPVEDLIAIRGWPEDRLTAAARVELVAAGLVVEEGAAVRIVHDIVRAAVETELPDEWRRDIDARVASRLETIAGENVTLLLRRRKPRIEQGWTTCHSPSGSYGHLCAGWWASTVSRRSPLSWTRCRPTAPQERELQGEVASLAAELGQQVLAMERWARIADRLDEPRDHTRAWLGASEAAQQLKSR